MIAVVYIRFAYDGKLSMTDARIILFSIQCGEDVLTENAPVLLAADFFDHRSVVVVYKINRDGTGYLLLYNLSNH